MIGYVARRLVWLVVVLLGASALTFALGLLAPGDPAQLILERTQELPPTPVQIAEKRVELGLDRPVSEQYVSWLGRAVRGDLGESWLSGESVSTSIRERLPRTLLLTSTAFLLSIMLALPVGVLAASKRNTLVDNVFRAAAIVVASTPGFLLAYVLILLLAVRLQLLPAFGFGSAADLVLPALALALGSAAGLSRFTRSAVLEVMEDDYMRTARAKGVGTSDLLLRHALRNAFLPIATVIGLSLGGLFGGAFIVEWIFNWPGIGTLAVEAINDKDYPVIQGFVLVTAAAAVVANFLTDLAYGLIDPRVRVVGGGRPR